MQDEIWRELARAKYLQWEVEAVGRAHEYDAMEVKLRAAAGVGVTGDASENSGNGNSCPRVVQNACGSFESAETETEMDGGGDGGSRGVKRDDVEMDGEDSVMDLTEEDDDDKGTVGSVSRGNGGGGDSRRVGDVNGGALGGARAGVHHGQSVIRGGGGGGGGGGLCAADWETLEQMLKAGASLGVKGQEFGV